VKDDVDMISLFRRIAVRWIKPHLSDATWDRLRHLGRGRAETPQPVPKPEPLPAPDPAVPDLDSMNLTELAVHFGTDKWGRHRYTGHYEDHLGYLRKRKFTMLEIGIGGYAREGKGGNSLRMWKHFYPRASIVGLDIQDKSFVDEHRIQTYKGSQTDEELLKTIMQTAGDVRIIIDDGSHRPEHIRETFRILFPLLRNGGWYIIEDTQTSYWPRYGGNPDRHATDTSMALVKDLVDGLNYEEYNSKGYRPTYSERHVVAVYCYHNLVFIRKGLNQEGSSGPHH
jgi:demethylmacrocin O-methyltransferase